MYIYIYIYFSCCYNDFNSCLLQMRQNASTSGKGIKMLILNSEIVNLKHEFTTNAMKPWDERFEIFGKFESIILRQSSTYYWKFSIKNVDTVSKMTP